MQYEAKIVIAALTNHDDQSVDLLAIGNWSRVFGRLVPPTKLLSRLNQLNEAR